MGIYYITEEDYYARNNFLRNSDTRSYEQYFGNKLSRITRTYKNKEYPFDIHIYLQNGCSIAFNPTEEYIIDGFCELENGWFLNVSNGKMVISRYRANSGIVGDISFLAENISYEKLIELYKICKFKKEDSLCMIKIKKALRKRYARLYKSIITQYEENEKKYPF